MFLKSCFSSPPLNHGQQTIGQSKHLRTEPDRKYLIENLERTKLEIIKETGNLNAAQWYLKLIQPTGQ